MCCDSYEGRPSVTRVLNTELAATKKENFDKMYAMIEEFRKKLQENTEELRLAKEERRLAEASAAENQRLTAVKLEVMEEKRRQAEMKSEGVMEVLRQAQAAAHAPM